MKEQLPKLLRQTLGRARETLAAMALLNIPQALSKAALRSVREFPQNSDLRARSDAPAETTMLCVWEGDRRMEWLAPAAEEASVRLVWVPRAVTKRAFHYLLHGYNRDATLGEANVDHYFAPEFEVARRKYRAFCKRFLKVIIAHYRADALLVPKLNDDWAIDFNMAAMEIGIPVIANDRESVITPKRMEMYPPILSKFADRFRVDAVALNNQLHYEFWRRSDYPEGKLFLTGKPDTDYWKRPATWRSLEEITGRCLAGKTIILYFSFGARTYLNFYYGDEKRTWIDLADQTHHVLADVLASNPNAVLIYKTGGKVARDYYRGFDAFVERLRAAGVEDNLIQLNASVRSWDIVRQSHVTVGFQTSGLIEAMFTDQPIIYCGWGEFHDDIRDTLLPLAQSPALFSATSADHMREFLTKALKDPEGWKADEGMKGARKTFRETYFYQPDGDASKRVLDLAKQVIADRRKG